MLRLRHSHLRHLDFHFPDALCEFFAALAESRYLGSICTIDISAGLSVIVSTVASVEQILDSGRCILFFKFWHLHTTTPAAQFSDREFVFSAYVNSRQLIRSLYRSIISYVGSPNDDRAYKSFQSCVLECYIDDDRYEDISFFRNNRMLGKFIGPAIANIRRHFQDIYNSIFDESEYS